MSFCVSVSIDADNKTTVYGVRKSLVALLGAVTNAVVLAIAAKNSATLPIIAFVLIVVFLWIHPDAGNSAMNSNITAALASVKVYLLPRLSVIPEKYINPKTSIYTYVKPGNRRAIGNTTSLSSRVMYAI